MFVGIFLLNWYLIGGVINDCKYAHADIELIINQIQ